MRTTRKTEAVLWAIQGVLAALFLFAGGMKLIMPVDALEQQAQMSGEFLKLIGACEALGGLGLILPGLLRIRVGLTPLAAAGLVIIMSGATVTSAMSVSVTAAIAPFVIGLLLWFVAYNRWQAPHRSSEVALQAASSTRVDLARPRSSCQ